MSQNNILKITRVTLLTIPPLVMFKDKFYSTYEVTDDSMEPTFKKNDILLVRKVTFFPFYHKHGINIEDLQNQNNNTKIDHETDRINMLRMDKSVGKAPVNEFTIWSTPTLSLPGDIIVYKNPHTFSPIKIDVSRIVGLGGQRVRPKDSYSKIINIPPYSVWVENDNDSFTKSKDSRTFGALSKKLIIGQVDRIIWPPSRWSSVGNERPAIGRAWWP